MTQTTIDYGGTGTDKTIDGENVGGIQKGYAVYDSATDADGTQYLAIAGKNSSFIQKINPDGTTERMPNVSRSTYKKRQGRCC